MNKLKLLVTSLLMQTTLSHAAPPTIAPPMAGAYVARVNQELTQSTDLSPLAIVQSTQLRDAALLYPLSIAKGIYSTDFGKFSTDSFQSDLNGYCAWAGLQVVANRLAIDNGFTWEELLPIQEKALKAVHGDEAYHDAILSLLAVASSSSMMKVSTASAAKASGEMCMTHPYFFGMRHPKMPAKLIGK